MADTSVAQYHQRAHECVQMALKTRDSGSKLLILHMANAWMKLAELAEKEKEQEARDAGLATASPTDRSSLDRGDERVARKG
jgi:phosphoribosyl 1,2-cyclic phosphodiesterase